MKAHEHTIWTQFVIQAKKSFNQINFVSASVEEPLFLFCYYHQFSSVLHTVYLLMLLIFNDDFVCRGHLETEELRYSLLVELMLLSVRWHLTYKHVAWC